MSMSQPPTAQRINDGPIRELLTRPAGPMDYTDSVLIEAIEALALRVAALEAKP